MSNVPATETGVPMEEDPEYFWDRYEDTVKMSTYLVAFVVSDFTYREGKKIVLITSKTCVYVNVEFPGAETSNGVAFKIWSREEAESQTGFAADKGPLILEKYEDYFLIDFPLPKQDMIAIPDFSSGAMENWGLITYR